jgi:hypothetical protein
MNEDLDKVLTRAKATRIPISSLAKYAGLNPRWLYDLMGGKLKNPPYKRVMILDNFLREHIKQLQSISD